MIVKQLTEGEYKKLSFKYGHALKNAMADVSNIVDDFNNRGRVVVHSVSSRIKSFESLNEKIARKGVGVDKIFDIAGIRIVVLFEDDISLICQALEEVFFYMSKDDYLTNPKPNGYRGVHYTVMVNTLVNGMVKKVPVEIQIKTALADALWSMEHVVKYKNNNPDPDAENRISEAAERVTELEQIMIKFRDYTI